MSSRWVHNGYGARDDDGAVCACSLLEYMILEGSESKLRFSYDRSTCKDMSRHVMACAQYPPTIYQKCPTLPLHRAGCDFSTTAFQYHLPASRSEDDFTTVHIAKSECQKIKKMNIAIRCRRRHKRTRIPSKHLTVLERMESLVKVANESMCVPARPVDQHTTAFVATCARK